MEAAFVVPVAVSAQRSSVSQAQQICAQGQVSRNTQIAKVCSEFQGSTKSLRKFARQAKFSARSARQNVSQISMTIAPEAAPVAASSETDPITLTRYLLEEQRAGKISDDLILLLSSIQTACKTIASQVNRAGISNLVGLAGATNVQGEDQKKLDVIANDVFKNSLKYSGRMGIIASEEEDEPVLVEENFAGNYVAVFDPLDGSSNIDAAVSTGSIFGIYEQVHACILEDGTVSEMDKRAQTCLVDVLQPGTNMVAAGYCMYSSSTTMVITLGHGVDGFTLDPLIGEFVLTHPKIQCPEKGSIYSFNEGNYSMWDKELQGYIDSLKFPEDGKPYSLRYIGSLVADIHRTLLYGGIYGYPGDSKNPNGKLRLLYECAPMGFIMEQAGGKASTGKERIMEVTPDKVHQRLPTFLGSVKDVEALESFYKN